MKNRKGMTLIEIIVALMIIGLIATVFLPSAVNSFSLMTNSKDLTEKTFSAQQNIEDNIETLRKTALPADLETISVKFNKNGTIIPIDIIGKTMMDIDPSVDDVDTMKLAAFIPKVDDPNDPSFPDVYVSIEPEYVRHYNEIETPKEVNIYKKVNASGDTATLKGVIDGKETDWDPKLDFENLLYRIVHNWYISDEDYDSTKVINFPYGFTKYSSEQRDTPNLDFRSELELKENMENKLIVYTITMVNTYGRYGEIFSDPVLIKNDFPIKSVAIKMLKWDGSEVLTSPFTAGPGDSLVAYITKPENFDISNLAGLSITQSWFGSTQSDSGFTIYTPGNNKDTIDIQPSFDTLYAKYQIEEDGNIVSSEAVQVLYPFIQPEFSGKFLIYLIGSSHENSTNTMVIDVTAQNVNSDPPIILYGKKTDPYPNQVWHINKLTGTDNYTIHWVKNSTEYYLVPNFNLNQVHQNGSSAESKWEIYQESGKYLISILDTGGIRKYMSSNNTTQLSRVTLSTEKYYWELVNID